MEINEEMLICKSEDMLEAPMDDSLALMSIEQGSYYGLNAVGKEIWEKIDTPIKVNEIVNLLLSKFIIDRETCYRETLIFLKKLNDRKMIVVK